MYAIFNNTLNRKFNSNSTAQFLVLYNYSLVHKEKFPETFTLFCKATGPFIFPRFLKILKQMQPSIFVAIRAYQFGN